MPERLRRRRDNHAREHGAILLTGPLHFCFKIEIEATATL
jgi:hypothetical protein